MYSLCFAVTNVNSVCQKSWNWSLVSVVGISLDVPIWNWIPSAECNVSGVRSEQLSVYSKWCRSLGALDSPLYKHFKWLRWEERSWFNVTGTLGILWCTFTERNAKRAIVLQISGTNNRSSAPSTICVSVVISMLCVLSSGVCFWREGFQRFESEGRAETCCDVRSNWFGFCMCVNCGLLP